MNTSAPRHYFVPLEDRIDVERLQSMDATLQRKLREFIGPDARPTRSFYAGERLDPTQPTHIGTKAIALMNQIEGDYDRIHDPTCWKPSEFAEEFPELMDFINDLPFKGYGRAFIIFDETGLDEPVHRDHGDPDLCQEFIWFRTNQLKRFYIYDKQRKQKHHVDQLACWFDTRHYHGTDPAEGLSISIRVDGVFTDELREHVANYKGLVPPKDLTIVEKVQRRLHNLLAGIRKPHAA